MSAVPSIVLRMPWTLLLLTCLAAAIVLVVATCVAAKLCNLDHIDLSANVLEVASFRLKVKSRRGRGG